MRFYIVPEVSFQSPTGLIRGPKYIVDFVDGDGKRVRYESLRYGLDESYLVSPKLDLTTAQHQTLVDASDVIVVPPGLDATITAGALPVVKQKMADKFFYSDWVTTAHTYRDVLRFMGQGAKFLQRFNARNVRRLFEAGITFTMRVNQLTQNQRDAILNVAAEFNLNTSTVVGTTLLGPALKILWDQMPGFTLNGEVF